jgi:hypothetical protein
MAENVTNERRIIKVFFMKILVDDGNVAQESFLCVSQERFLCY